MPMFDLFFPKHWSTLKKLIWLKAAALSSAVQKTVTAAIVHIKDALAGPAQQVTVAIDPVQDLHGYDNPWPAGGGVNIMPTLTPGTFTSGSLTAVVGADGKITVTGTKSAGSSTRINLGSFSDAYAVPVGAYVHFRNSLISSNITFDLGGTAPTLNVKNRIFQNSTERTATTSVSIYFTNNAEGTFDFTLQPSVELSGSTTDWTPYSNICPITGWTGANLNLNGTTIPITFPDAAGTVYGGTLDVTNGVLTVTWVCLNASNLSWTQAGNTPSRFSTILSASDYTSEVKTNLKCSKLKTVTSFPSASATAIFMNTKAQLVCNVKGFTTKAEWDALIASDCQIAYELATPQEITLTPQQITLLQGENNLWSDTGNTTLTYMADGRADDVEALNILLAGRYHNSGAADEATDAEALEILLGGKR